MRFYCFWDYMIFWLHSFCPSMSRTLNLHLSGLGLIVVRGPYECPKITLTSSESSVSSFEDAAHKNFTVLFRRKSPFIDFSKNAKPNLEVDKFLGLLVKIGRMCWQHAQQIKEPLFWLSWILWT